MRKAGDVGRCRSLFGAGCSGCSAKLATVAGVAAVFAAAGVAGCELTAWAAVW